MVDWLRAQSAMMTDLSSLDAGLGLLASEARLLEAAERQSRIDHGVAVAPNRASLDARRELKSSTVSR